MKNQKILWEKPAVLLRDALVVGDLHIGIETELREHGVRMGSFTSILLDDLLEAIKQTKAKKVVILGDLKHKLMYTSPQETKEIPEFLKILSERVEVKVVLGNHDAGIKHLLKGYEVHPSSGFLFHEFLLCHGNARPNKDLIDRCEEIVACHWHPVFEFKDRLGGRVVEKIWVKAEAFGKPVLVLPTFNRLLGGTTLDRINKTWVDFNNAEMYLMNGINLGRFKGGKGSG